MISTATTSHLDFADTRARPALGHLEAADGTDAADLLAGADAADLYLLRLVGCAALATLMLALATGLTV